MRWFYYWLGNDFWHDLARAMSFVLPWIFDND